MFKSQTFEIASDISLTTDVAYIQGHPIVKTKTVVLNYRQHTFKANERTRFTERLIKDVTDPIYVVELMNYLSRLINHDNLFEIYVNNRNTEKYSLEELTFANKELEELGRPPQLDKMTKSEYTKGLIDDSNHFVKSQLLKTMNARFTRTFASIESLDYVPVYGYISESGKVDGNWKAEPILHLAIVFNVLAHQEQFSGINNQEAIASFNSIMKAKALDMTAERINKSNFKTTIKRLEKENMELREENKILNEDNDELTLKNVDLVIELKKTNQQLSFLTTLNQEQSTQIDTLINMQIEANERLRKGEQRDKHMQRQLEVSNHINKSLNRDVKLSLKQGHAISKQLSKQDASNHSTKTLTFKIYFYISDQIPKDKSKREIAYEEVWLGCACGEKRYVKPRMPSDRVILYKREINSRYIYQYIVDNSYELIRETNYRHIRILIENVGHFFTHVDNLLDSQSEHRSIQHLDRLEERIRERDEQRKQLEDEAKENEEEKAEVEELENRKKELIEEYEDELHFVVSNWKRKVYRQKQANKIEIWTIRFGAGGRQTRELTRNEILNGQFTNESDPRIRYEN